MRDAKLRDTWEEAWAEYDQRSAAPPGPMPPRPDYPAGADAADSLEAGRVPGRRRRLLPVLALMGLAGLAAAMLTPFGAARQVAQALAAEDAAALAPHLDAPAIRTALGIWLDPASRLGGQADAYLGGMADEIQAGLGHPTAIAGMLLARGARGAGWPVPDGPTRYAMTLTGGREPILLRLELGEGLRWRVTRVVLGEAR